MRTVTLNQKQQREVEILARLKARALDVGTAAGLLGVSPRQVRRLRARFHREGFGAVLHGNVGRVPANHTDPALVVQILALAGPKGKYEDLNVCHLQDLLDRQGEIKNGTATLGPLLQGAR